MDIATITGVLSAFILIVLSVVMGKGGFSNLLMFVDLPSVLIVLGGTIGATLVNFPLQVVLNTIGIAKNAFFNEVEDIELLIKKMVEFSSVARRDGILALQDVEEEIKNPFLVKGIQLAVDGMEPQVISQILDTEIDYLKERHSKGVEVFIAMGTFAPAFGLIGTLIGLVMMLKSLNDPSTIGPAMAVALITTFYGAVLANVLFLPIAGKLKTRSKDEIMLKDIVKEGILSIAAGDNPRILERKLHAFLEPKMRRSSFEK